LLLVTPNARSLPLRTCGMVPSIEATVTDTWPATSARIDSPPPRYGTCSMRVPVK
jgi:hypothetical protein